MEMRGEGRISARLRTRTYLSISHIFAADFFSQNCAQIEKTYNGIFSDELFNEHRSYVIGAIFSAVAFLEATINEFLADTVDHPEGEAVGNLDPTTKTILADMWKNDVVGKFSIIDKFQVVLAVNRKNLFDSAAPTYQAVDDLIKLRNALVHYKPEWIESSQGTQDQKTAHKFEKHLRGKFPLNPLTSFGNPFYPDKCLSHGCAEWAVTSSLNFIDEFFSKLGYSYPFGHIRPLKTER
jgi:hypothetical protein